MHLHYKTPIQLDRSHNLNQSNDDFELTTTSNGDIEEITVFLDIAEEIPSIRKMPMTSTYKTVFFLRTGTILFRRIIHTECRW